MATQPYNSRFETADLINHYDTKGTDAAMMYEAAMDFAQKYVSPKNAEMDRNSAFHTPLWKEMGHQQLLGMTVSKEFGGHDAGYLAHLGVMEALSYYSGSVGLSYVAHSNLCMNQIQLNGNKEQQKKYLPKLVTGEYVGALAMSEPNAGSDVMSMGTRATKADGGYKLNGSKLWITNGGTADVLVVYAKTSPEKGAKGVTTFLVEKGMPGFKPGKKLDKIGMRGSETWELFFNDCFVPDENVMGAVDGGAKVLMSGLNYERLLLSGGPLGLAQNSLDITIKHLESREQFGKKLSKNQALSHQVADMYSHLATAREITYANAAKVTAGKSLTNRTAASVFLQASATAADITMHTIRHCGGMGYTKDLPLGQNHNDALLYEIGGGTRDIRLEIIARDLFLA